MVLKYDLSIDNKSIKASIIRLTNQVYKLLPVREEGGEWQKPLMTIMEEIAGMNRLFIDQQPGLFKLSCKLEGLFTLVEENDFLLYRSVIFECLSILGDLQKCLV
jgi:hypothetical protein